MDWIRLIKAMLISILAIGNIWILINIFDSDVYAYIFLAECSIAIFIFIVWIAYHAIGWKEMERWKLKITEITQGILVSW